MTFITRFSVILILVTNLNGCTKDPLNRGKVVTGKVTLDGVPLSGGTVVFESIDGKFNPQSVIQLDGTYTIQEPPLGTSKIAVKTSHMKSFAPPATLRGKVPKNQYPGFNEEEVGYYTPIPAKYENTASSELTIEIKAGGEIPKHNIDLKSK